MAENWVACAGVDTERFKRSCRTPLLANQWNVWRVQRTNKDNADEDWALGSQSPLAGKPANKLPGMRYVLRWWFEKLSGGPQLWFDAFDHLEISLRAPNQKLVRVASFRDLERLECGDLISVPERAGGKVFDIWLSFVYRGNVANMPWPAYRSDDFGAVGFESWCPTMADFALTEVYTFERRIVPEKPKPSIVPDFANPSKGITGWIFWGGVITLTGYLFATSAKERIERVV